MKYVQLHCAKRGHSGCERHRANFGLIGCIGFHKNVVYEPGPALQCVRLQLRATLIRSLIDDRQTEAGGKIEPFSLAQVFGALGGGKPAEPHAKSRPLTGRALPGHSRSRRAGGRNPSTRDERKPG